MTRENVLNFVKVTTVDGVAVVTIDRQDKLNALNREVMREIASAFASLRDDDQVGCVVLTGAGPKAFVAGADIAELAENRPLAGEMTSSVGQACFLSIERLGKPVIGAINGFALGGGLELAMACTFRTASENARMGLPEITLGIIPGYGGTQRLVRIVGRGRALEMMLTGDMIDAAEAYRVGLVNHVFSAADLLPKTMEIATKLAKRAPIAARFILDAVHRGNDQSIEEGQRLEATLFGLIASTQDTQEGLRAFLDKRKPDFKGE